jgi:hypothetical protein
VEFHGATLFAVERPEGVFVAINPICDALGLAANKQKQRIQADPILSEGGTVTVLPSAGGPQETFCLRMDLLHGWLFTIDESRVKDEETRQRVLLYKRECYAVLFRHFTNGQSVAPVALDEDGDTATPDGLKLRKVNTAVRCFGERAGAQLWVKLGLEWVPAMAGALSQPDLLDNEMPPVPGTVTVTVTPGTPRTINGNAH